MSKTNLAFLNLSSEPARSPDAASATSPVGDPTSKLGPAEVLSVGPGYVEVRLEHGAVARAELALATPYEAVVGDQLLVIGQADRHWVIGVIRGRGRTVLSFDGDVELRSNDGVLRLASGKRVEVESPDVSFHVGTLRTVADAVIEHVSSLTQRVRALMSVHAGQRREIIDGSTSTQARSSTLVTEGDVKVNGKAIHLG
jgi:hypothetical protein